MFQLHALSLAGKVYTCECSLWFNVPVHYLSFLWNTGPVLKPLNGRRGCMGVCWPSLYEYWPSQMPAQFWSIIQLKKWLIRNSYEQNPMSWWKWMPHKSSPQLHKCIHHLKKNNYSRSAITVRSSQDVKLSRHFLVKPSSFIVQKSEEKSD